MYCVVKDFMDYILVCLFSVRKDCLGILRFVSVLLMAPPTQLGSSYRPHDFQVQLRTADKYLDSKLQYDA